MNAHFLSALPDELTTSRFVLKKTTLQDALPLFQIWSDSAVAEFMNIEKFSSVYQAEEMIKAITAEPDAIRYTIFSQEQVIGSFGINEVNVTNNTAEIGYELAQKYWRKGIMTELLRDFLPFLQDKLHLSGVYAKVIPENTASTILLKKLGFEISGEAHEWDQDNKQLSKVLIFEHSFKKASTF
ncbi:GNAT family N-acetyltransferase [Listeria aquatica]|uniref:Putative acetyltransferase n=1 Tax=Listeria aquatica FSL S10-1188 TaxID=1265818 RepID=W7AY27_9LIST|nr:GNAT family N-acetyltransferase [Listeria aquatica]EUJ18160.1 putative acetyltransferase [Listeria aquatica FSL S10-1188]